MGLRHDAGSTRLLKIFRLIAKPATVGDILQLRHCRLILFLTLILALRVGFYVLYGVFVT